MKLDERPRKASTRRRRTVRAAIGDGSYGGPYAVSDDDALRIWEAGVTEVRALIETL